MHPSEIAGDTFVKVSPVFLFYVFNCLGCKRFDGVGTVSQQRVFLGGKIRQQFAVDTSFADNTGHGHANISNIFNVFMVR